jgi:hypothetical protein
MRMLLEDNAEALTPVGVLGLDVPELFPPPPVPSAPE